MKQGERRGFGLAPFISDLRQVAKPLLGKRGFGCIDIIERWVDIVGPDLSTGVRPEKITYAKGARDKGTLCVLCQGGAYATLLEHRKKIILERINTFLGFQGVAEIKLRQGASFVAKSVEPAVEEISIPAEAEKHLESKAALIEDADLRQAVLSLGKAIFQRKHAK